ncbi:MAG: hypothetical protein H8E76_10465 [Helicobacteraceae bacterium]|nr:hypothetical protein [Candidatus Sulfurimonas ponti]MBL6973388.1 hypothetical protein [Sulfurimonas sp.]
MELKYVGPKPIISHRGIKFDSNKEDKYIYLYTVLQLLKAVHHDYHEDEVYKYNADVYGFCNDELVREMREFCPNMNVFMKNERHKIEDRIRHHIQRLQRSRTLTNIEKEAFQNNLEILHDYIIQRFINKSVYYYAVDTLGQRLREYRIDYIIAPMFQKFDHVLHSVQGVLLKGKYPIDTKLDIYEEDRKLLVKLQVL